MHDSRLKTTDLGTQLPDARVALAGFLAERDALIFRAADRSLSLFSLVVPPGAATPIHDHLAWGLVGLYRGEQAFEVNDTCGGQTGSAECGRVLKCLAVADYSPS